MRAIVVGLALFALADSGAAQSVPSPWVDQLVVQLTRVERALAPQGFARVQGPFTGSLGRQGVKLFDVTLDGGADYRIVAVCDADCRDLDLRLYDQAGNLISENVASPEAPIVGAQPRWTGPFSIEITMTHCAAAPCYYAAYVYAR